MPVWDLANSRQAESVWKVTTNSLRKIQKSFAGLANSFVGSGWFLHQLWSLYSDASHTGADDGHIVCLIRNMLVEPAGILNKGREVTFSPSFLSLPLPFSPHPSLSLSLSQWHTPFISTSPSLSLVNEGSSVTAMIIIQIGSYPIDFMQMITFLCTQGWWP